MVSFGGFFIFIELINQSIYAGHQSTQYASTEKYAAHGRPSLTNKQPMITGSIFGLPISVQVPSIGGKFEFIVY